jgi:ParB family chromosome partitioning protein
VEKNKTKKGLSKGLGRGLNALFEDVAEDKTSVKTLIEKEENYEGQVVSLKIIDVEPNPNQPRRNFDKDALEALADSIKAHGVVSPILVQKGKKGMYIIIAGERRWRASKLAGLKEVPCIIKDYSKEQVMEIALIENLQREDLNPIEEAEGYKSLMDTFSFTQEQISEKVGKSRSAIANALRLNNLCSEIKSLVIEKKLSQGHARTLLPVTDKALQIQIAEKIIKDDLSVRQTEKLVSDLLNSKPKKEENKKSPSYKNVEKQLSDIFKTKVKISSGKNKGKIEFEFYNSEDFERLLFEIKK